MSHHLPAVAILTLGAALLVRVPARACATVTQTGSNVAVATENALIIWDEQAKKQHFIRRASFDTHDSFGFLVPTPTRPELAEAPDELFTRLQDWTRPEVRTQKVYFTPSEWWRIKTSLGKELGGAVTVLKRQRVAGLDAVVLQATDARALNNWLRKHGYASRPALEAWLGPYVKAGWTITAFRIARASPSAPDVETKAIRMSFAAERPFFPYSEPIDKARDENLQPHRFLRIFLVAGGRLQGAFEDVKRPWSGRAVWAGPLQDDWRETMREHLGGTVPIAKGAWLTVYDDVASPRAATADLFAPSPDQSELRRPPIIRYEEVVYPTWGLLGLCAAATLVVSSLFQVWFILRRRRRERPSEPPVGGGETN